MAVNVLVGSTARPIAGVRKDLLLGFEIHIQMRNGNLRFTKNATHTIHFNRLNASHALKVPVVKT